jgi:hypothetical protein
MECQAGPASQQQTPRVVAALVGMLEASKVDSDAPNADLLLDSQKLPSSLADDLRTTIIVSPSITRTDGIPAAFVWQMKNFESGKTPSNGTQQRSRLERVLCTIVTNFYVFEIGPWPIEQPDWYHVELADIHTIPEGPRA